jgi:hypothetical protein
MKITINRLKRELEEIQEKYFPTNDFYWGDFLSAYKEGKTVDGLQVPLTYPAMVCYTTGGAMTEKMVGQTLTIIICDKVYEGHSNLVDTESDTLQCVRDIYNIINRAPRWRKMCTIRGTSVPKFFDRGGDMVAGHYIEINLDLKDSKSYCNLPLDDYNFDESNLPVIPDGAIFNTIGTVLGIPQTGVDFTVIDTPVQLLDTDSTLISTNSIVSVTGGSIVAPDATATNSDTSYSDVIVSGGTLVVPDSTVNVNGSIEGSVVSIKTIDINISDGIAPVTPSSINLTGNTVDIEISLSAGSIGARLLKSGSTDTSNVYDDGSLQLGREVDLDTLDGLNIYGNNTRFTDFAGVQTFATNNIVLDHTTDDGVLILGYYKSPHLLAGADWNAMMTYCGATFIEGGFTGWHNTNEPELRNIRRPKTGGWFNYVPFNIPSGNFYHTSTADPLTTTSALYSSPGGYVFATFPKGANAGIKPFPCRYFTRAELGF